MSRNAKYGMAGIFNPPPQANIDAAMNYEAEGIDWVTWWDQSMGVPIPRSIWTPDLIPASKSFDIDCYLDAFSLMATAAQATKKIGIGLTGVDALRRPPSVLAQTFATIDHISKGRAFFALGAGEIKQFRPYGIPREKPFTQLEESIKIIRQLWEHYDRPISYEGPIWNMKDAIIAVPPYEGKRPPLLIACGPGRGMEITGKWADGWVTYAPACGDAEWYAKQVKEVKLNAEKAGRDPESLMFVITFVGIIGPTEDYIEHAINTLPLKWAAAALIPGPEAFTRYGYESPLGNWAYARDLVTTEWSREDTLRIAATVPPEMVRNVHITGTPKQAAAQMQAYVDAGCTHLVVGNMGALVSTGEWSSVGSGRNVMYETFDEMRKLSGQKL